MGATDHQLCYVSKSLVRPHSPEMLSIVRACLQRNPRMEISGALWFDNWHFFQVLEGPLRAIRRLFERIRSDERHRYVVEIDLRPLPARRFARWPMKFVDGTSHRREAPTFSHESLVSVPEAERERRVDLLRRL